MPRYTYECKECEQEFDVAHHYKEVLTECKLCKSDKVNRVISKVYVFRGNKSEQKAGTKIKETISETVEEMKKYKKEATKEMKIK